LSLKKTQQGSVLFEWHTGRGADCLKKMLIGSCKALGIIPEEYLNEVFTMTNQTAKEWTPSAWKARRQAQNV
jgi:hypothetical protein